MRKALPLLLSILAVAYPLAVYFGLQFLEPWVIGLSLATLFALRLLFLLGSRSPATRSLLPVLLLAMVCALGSVLLNSHATLRLTPAFINFASMVVFALTLWRGPPMIERFARIMDPDLSEHGVRYARKVTIAWCGFFFGNGLIALYTAWFTSLAFWTLYNGLIAYGLMGLFFAVELCLRRRVMKRTSL